MMRDFRPPANPLPSPNIESPGVPYSSLESTAVLETFWRRRGTGSEPPTLVLMFRLRSTH